MSPQPIDYKLFDWTEATAITETGKQALRELIRKMEAAGVITRDEVDEMLSDIVVEEINTQNNTRQ